MVIELSFKKKKRRETSFQDIPLLPIMNPFLYLDELVLELIAKASHVR